MSEELKMPDEIMKRVNTTILATKQRIKDTTGSDDPMLPMAHVFKGSSLGIYATPFNSGSGNIERYKDKIADMLKEVCKDPQVDLFIYVQDAWALSFNSEAQVNQFNKERSQGKWKTFAEHPMAREQVVFLVETRSDSWIGKSPILKHGTLRVFGHIEWSQGSHEGRFANILNREKNNV